MPENKYSYYLKDLGTITKEYAREAIKEHIEAKGTDSEDYKTGYMMGFHRFITLMQQQAESFDIPLDELGLDDIEEDEFFK
jgi:hypothetical protein